MSNDTHPLLVLLFFITFAFAFVAIFWQRRKEQDQRESILHILAKKMGAKVRRGGKILTETGRRPSELHFSRLGKKCRIGFYGVHEAPRSKYPTPYTRFTMDLGAKPPFSTHIFKEGSLQGLSKAIGFQDIQIGDAYFDNMFMIKGNKEDRVRRFLSQPVREAITQLEAILTNQHIDVQVKGKELCIQKLGWLEDLKTLELFLDLCQAVTEGYLASCRISVLARPDMPTPTPDPGDA